MKFIPCLNEKFMQCCYDEQNNFMIIISHAIHTNCILKGEMLFCESNYNRDNTDPTDHSKFNCLSFLISIPLLL